MASSSTPYTKLENEAEVPSAPLLEEPGQDKAAMFNQLQQEHLQQSGGDAFHPQYPSPPPPYSEQQSQPVPMKPYPPQEQSYPPPQQSYPPPQQSYPPPQLQYPPPQQPYPAQQAGTNTIVMMPTPQPAPPPQQGPVVVVQGGLPPGACSVCRKGTIKKSPSCCTYFCCFIMLFADNLYCHVQS
ncbi:hypothetical protein Pcinc_027788 [Petrolisthes cinctipes]|uniref:Uncharacterized protein n=1 Tax=Petrolisthes cinctipes TaxID=88211 RepID=A0AAE1F3A3_PETCI|nr:hypothetical protein Pcinc_027788 [Petrolisthes cinctipes]